MAIIRPATVPLIDSNQTNRSAPPASKQTDGFLNNDIYPSDELNWINGFASDWLAWLDERSTNGATPGRDLFLQGVSAAGASADPGGIANFRGGSGDGVAACRDRGAGG